ncbi:MAG: hypothetical protein CL477_05085 [Acidobacteria bacterium]|jgi:hypothetical protein|nr:hypothetical protein [Acidobacteriota bacterium]
MNDSGAVVLRDLADHQAFTLGAFCRDCDRNVTLDQQALADRFGAGRAARGPAPSKKLYS